MTISTTTTFNEATGTGAVTVFPFTFVVQDADTVKVYLDDVLETVGYTVALNSNQTSSPGGTVTFTSAPGDGMVVLVQRETPLTQPLNLPAYGTFSAESIETALDRQALVAQDISGRLDSEAVTRAAADAEEIVQRSSADAALADAISQARVDFSAGGGGFGDGTAILATGTVNSRTLADQAADTVRPEQFGTVGSGDDTAAVQAALDTGKLVQLRRGTTYTVTNLTAVAGGGLLGDRSTIVRKAAGTGALLTIAVAGFRIAGVKFDGGNAGPYNAAGAVAGSKSGIYIAGTPGAVSDVDVRDSEVTGCDLYGIYVGDVAARSDYRKGCVFTNVNCHHNYGNWYFDTYGEYSLVSNCQGNDGWYGVRVIGGNTKVQHSNFHQNHRNCWLDTGTNASHGGFYSCSFNHPAVTGYGLYATNVVMGFIFSGCMFWYADIKLDNCFGISIHGGEIATLTLTVVGGNQNDIHHNWLSGVITKVFSGTVRTVLRDNWTNYNETARDNCYPDYLVDAYSNSSASWHSATDFNWAGLWSFNDRKVSGVEDTSIYGVIPITGKYNWYMAVTYGNASGSNQMVSFKVKIYTDGTKTTVRKTHLVEVPVLLSLPNQTTVLNFTEWCAYGETWDVFFKTTVANGILLAGTDTAKLIVQTVR